MQPNTVTTQQRAVRIIVPAIIFFVGIVVGFSFSSTEQGTDIARGEAVSMMIDTGVGKIETFTGIVPLEGETLFALTRRTAQGNNLPFAYKDYAGLGAMITQIGPVQDSSSGAYWQYWVNNVYAQVGAAAYEVQPGDVVVWKFTSSKQ